MAACGRETSRSEPSPLSHTPRLEPALRRRRFESSEDDADSLQTTRPQLVFRDRRDAAGKSAKSFRTHRPRTAIRARLISARPRRRQHCLVVAAADAGGEEAVNFLHRSRRGNEADDCGAHEPAPLTPSLSPEGGEGGRRTGEGAVHDPNACAKNERWLPMNLVAADVSQRTVSRNRVGRDSVEP